MIFSLNSMFYGSSTSYNIIDTSRNGLTFILCRIVNMGLKLTIDPCLRRYHCCRSAGEMGFPDSWGIWNDQITWNSSSEYLLMPIWEICSEVPEWAEISLAGSYLGEDSVQKLPWDPCIVVCVVALWYLIYRHGLVDDKSLNASSLWLIGKKQSCSKAHLFLPSLFPATFNIIKDKQFGRQAA